MPSEAAEKAERRAQKKRERQSRIPKSMEGGDSILVSWEEFQTIFKRALEMIGVTDVNFDMEQEKVQFSSADAPKGAIVSSAMRNVYNKQKFFPAQHCLYAVARESMRGTLHQLKAVFDTGDEDPPENLFLTVKTHEHVLRYNNFVDSRTGERFDHVVYRPVSSNTGELFIALVIGTPGLDSWIPSQRLKRWKMTEEEAIALAIRNMERITPPHLACRVMTHDRKNFTKYQEMSRRRDALTPIKQMFPGEKGGGGALIVSFADARAIPRLLLPRVVERLAELLRCKATSIVVIPVDDNMFRAASAEDPKGMLLMAIHQILPYTQGDNRHLQCKVTKLRNEMGLAELEPYLVDGGRFAVQFWEGAKKKAFYPYPRTEDDIHFLEDAYGRSAKRGFVMTLTEDVFLQGVCWQCRQKSDRLMKCGNCKKANYCSRAECQKEAWAAGHNVNCEERRRYWEKAKMCRFSKSMMDKSKEARATLSDADLERLRKVSTA
ncbi:hypothetical protein KFL_001480120 [Klebsormidium nitens]|uniref:MYND-type domain-containing protein n=1 Tax=Klebsormidium nitens TaxID=105231 RepID=A0A1Y1HZ26_KLENI|nr:hypothetical protein KFL_001480120 [Klebsormidium nitens]|eukprot:GAQ83443.1 hypothetical protein KFL_001480120 [Klebsormidium nitens]